MIKINFWLERPPFAIVGFLKPLKQMIGDLLSIYVRDDSVSNRKGFDQEIASELGCVFVHKDLSNISASDVAKDSINIINGFNSFVYHFLSKQREADKSVVVGCYTEMPAPMGKMKFIKKTLLRIKYKRIVSNALNNIDFLLPIGQLANNYYKKIGWNKLSFPFVYIPDIYCNHQTKSIKKFDDASFCYVGRNDFSNKGLNKLIRIAKNNKKLKLIIVGKYGNDSDKVSRIACKTSNITHLDSMQPNDVLKFLSSEKIGCVVVPSNSDGWNPNVYMSLISGTPCIATCQSGSSDLIDKFNYGYVCGSTYRSLKKAITIFDNSSIEQKKRFADNAINASPNLLPESIANQLLNFLETHFSK